MDSRIRWIDRVRYWIDNTFSKGTSALIVMLGALTFVIITAAAALLALSGINQAGTDGNLDFGEAAWQALMHTFDSGAVGADTGPGYRLVMLIVTIGGIFVFSTLIGVLTSGLEGKIEELRKGRSRVIEQNHIVILGWSEQIFTILSELIIANDNLKNSAIVIMAEKDKIEMDDAIRERVGNTGRTHIVCRTGSPIEMSDLHIVSLNSSKAVVVLSPESEDPDSEVIKTILAITHFPGRRKEHYHIVAELREPRNLEIARVVGAKEVEWILVGDLVARIIAQTCRQSGLSIIYNELLDFGGDEIYFTQPAALIGKSYAEALDRFENNTVMGIRHADGTTTLNPPHATVLSASDSLVVIAADDDKILYNPDTHAAIQEKRIASGKIAAPKPEKTLLLGWNWRGPSILRELDNYVAPGSETLILTRAAAADQFATKNMQVAQQNGDITDRATLEKIHVGQYDHIILLSEIEGISTQQADSRTLITLLHLRDMADKGKLDLSITSEMIDVRNRNLAEVTRADDFIVSGRLISLMLAQVAENKALNSVFGDIFDPEGAEVYLKPAEKYITPAKDKVNFYTVVESARRQGETALGYRLASQSSDISQTYGVHLNPPKAEEIQLQTGDTIIVLAEG
jgi:voltage-gated potassium channel Kch